MTGAYVRIQRNGKWENVEIDQLTDFELAEFAKSQPVEKGWAWTIWLAGWIRNNVKQTQYVEDEIETREE